MTRRGRPRKPGRRQPGGRLARGVEPNPIVVDQRRAMLGSTGVDGSAAEDPMTLAFARGWISEAQLRAGVTFARTYREVFGSRRTAPGYESPDPTDRDPRPIGQMADVEIVTAFDAIMDATTVRVTGEERQQAASERWGRWGHALTRQEHHEVFAAFVGHVWPQWLTWQVADRDQTADSLRRRAALLTGLDAVARLLRPASNQSMREMAGSSDCAPSNLRTVT